MNLAPGFRLSRRAMVFLFAAMVVLPDSAADEAEVIKPEDARSHENQSVTVEFTVRGARELADKGVCFLNSEKDHKLSSNFTAFITPKALKALKEDAKIERPADHYLEKTVRVTGTVKLFKEQAEIKVETPDQLVIVETP